MSHFIKVEPLQSCLFFKGMDAIEERTSSFLSVSSGKLTSNEVGPTAANEISNFKNIVWICQTSTQYKWEL